MSETAADEDVPDVRARWEPRSPIVRYLASLYARPRGYQLARWLILRLLGLIYLFAFLGLVRQGPALLGAHGLTPVGIYLEQLSANGLGFWDMPSLLWFGSSDGAMAVWAWIGLLLSIAVLLGYANLPMLLALWAIYGSFVRVGQLWFSFGWEIQILETTLLAAVMAHPWDPRPLKAPPPPGASVVLMKWLAFRIMLGAGLIKLRGDACWTDLTCLDAHFETQPIPNPLSPLFHHLPHALQAAGVVFNHVVELVLPFLLLAPRSLRLVAGIGMAAFQLVLIASGNLAFLNWLTLVPVLACFDDDFLLRLVPRRPRAWLAVRLAPPPPRDGKAFLAIYGAMLVAVLAWSAFPSGAQVVLAVAATGVLAAVVRTQKLHGHRTIVAVFAAIVTVLSVPVVGNLLSKRQAMNRSYDRFAIVNTYGAFGSVGMTRNELVIEGTLDPDPETATWSAYALPCAPGPLDRRPCLLGPYHRRLDWLIWFAAMSPVPRDPWVIHLVYKLLDGDTLIRGQLAIDPFDGKAPTWVRIRRFVYHLEPYGSNTWWTRDSEELWLEPVHKDTPGLREAIERFGWPSPTMRE